MLQNLNEVALKAQTKRNEYKNVELKLSPEFTQEFVKEFPDMKIKFFDYTAEHISSDGLFVIIPNQWFVIASYFVQLFEQLMEYKSMVKAINLSNKEITTLRETGVFSENVTNKINTLELSDVENGFLKKFLSDYSWWFGSKSIDRGDFFVSTILTLSKSVHLAQGFIPVITTFLSNKPHLVKLLIDAGDEAKNTQTNASNDALNVKKEFATWLQASNTNTYFENVLARVRNGLDRYETEYNSEFSDKLFEVDLRDVDRKIQIVEENISNKTSKFYTYSDSKSNHQPRAILGKENYSKFLKELASKATNFASKSPENGYNKIYFGAPGTGKSYSVTQLLKENKVRESNTERVTFHPDYDYSSFIGGYKPVTEIDEEGNESVKYKFVPQVFINIYEKAWRDPHQNFYLIIEEINRGNCAEIFGDIFQLLDRNPDYSITPSEDLFKYLNKRDEFSANKSLYHGKLVMPDNLIILATMNTSDQSLYPMDSAFKRRWDWEYVSVKYPVDDTDRSCRSFDYKIIFDEKNYVNWIDFVKSINFQIMQNPSLGMDKCLGNFFVKPDENGVISIDTVINKVMFYLWNDVFRDEENEIFSDHIYNDYFPIATNGKARLHALSNKYELIRESVVAASPENIAIADEESAS